MRRGVWANRKVVIAVPRSDVMVRTSLAMLPTRVTIASLIGAPPALSSWWGWTATSVLTSGVPARPADERLWTAGTCRVQLWRADRRLPSALRNPGGCHERSEPVELRVDRSEDDLARRRADGVAKPATYRCSATPAADARRKPAEDGEDDTHDRAAEDHQSRQRQRAPLGRGNLRQPEPGHDGQSQQPQPTHQKSRERQPLHRTDGGPPARPLLDLQVGSRNSLVECVGQPRSGGVCDRPDPPHPRTGDATGGDVAQLPDRGVGPGSLDRCRSGQ